MSTPFYTTIGEQIRGESDFGYGHRAMHTILKVSDSLSGSDITLPHKSLVSDYMDYLKGYVKEITLDEKQYEHFRGNPQAFSEAMYGSTQYWSTILELNRCKSRIEFNKRTVKYYDPMRVAEILNEVLLKAENP